MASIKADEITKILKAQIANYDQSVAVDEVGTVISVGDGIARVYGLEKVMAGEMLAFPHDVFGIALNLEEDQVGAVLLGEYTLIAGGRHGQAHRHDHVRAGGRGAGRPRGQSAGSAARRQGPDRHRISASRSSASLPASSTASRCASRCKPASRPSTR